MTDVRRAAGLRIDVALRPGLARGVPGDVATALQNLLVNAHEHAPGARVSVEVRTAGELVQVTVSDDGPGMPSPSAASLFDRGVTWARRAVARVSACRSLVQLVRRQGGELELGGTATRDCHRDDLRDLPTVGGQLRRGRLRVPRRGLMTDSPSRRLPVLIVDDHRLMADSLCVALRLEGFEPVVAAIADPARPRRAHRGRSARPRAPRPRPRRRARRRSGPGRAVRGGRGARAGADRHQGPAVDRIRSRAGCLCRDRQGDPLRGAACPW